MVAPLVALASLAIVIGFLVNPLFDIGPIKKHSFATFVTERNVAVFTGGHGEAADEGHGESSHLPDAVEAGAAPEFSLPVAVVSTALAVGGILLAYSMYITGSISPTAMGRRLPTVHNLLYRKYYVDELYEDRLVIRVFYARAVRFLSWFDVAWIDNVNVQLSKLTANVGRGLANVQTGQTQTYAAIMAIGVVVALLALLVWGN